MEEGDLALWVVVALAFAGGYWFVSKMLAYLFPKKADAESDGGAPAPDDSPCPESDGNTAIEMTDPRAFAVFGIATLPDEDELKRIYRELAVQYHPDKVQHLAPEFKTIADQKIREINQAYDHLKKKLDREAR